MRTYFIIDSQGKKIGEFTIKQLMIFFNKDRDKLMRGIRDYFNGRRRSLYGYQVEVGSEPFYAVYNLEDEPMFVGSAQEVADYLGVKKKSVYEMVSRTKQFERGEWHHTPSTFKKVYKFWS